MCCYLAFFEFGDGISGALLLGLMLALLGLAIYFLPSWVGRRKRNATAIFALNLLLGWTFIGWVSALVWALMVDTKTKPALG
jgi:Superinfection immunity protein